jgi:MFS family permease
MGRAALKQLRGSLRAFREVFGNRQLRRLEAAWASAMFGYSGLNIVVMVYGYETGGAKAAGVMALLRVLPGALAAPFTSALADRYPRERVLLVSNVLRTVFVAVAAADAVGGGPSWIVFSLTAAVGIAGSCFRPAQAALVRGLARTPDELTAANVVASTIQAMGLRSRPGSPAP